MSASEWPVGLTAARDPIESHHEWVCTAALRTTLAAARIGQLSPTWRHDRRESIIRVSPPRYHPPLPIPTELPTPGRLQTFDLLPLRPPPPITQWPHAALSQCLLSMPEVLRGNVIRDAQASGVDATAVCAELDAAAIASAAWEPSAACGDWRAALDAWYRASLEVHDRWARTRTRTGAGPSFDFTFLRDLLGVSYHAGIDSQTGGDTWKDWLSECVDQWADQGLARIYRLAMLDYDAPYWGEVSPPDDPYRGAFSNTIPNVISRLPLHALPEYWTKEAT